MPVQGWKTFYEALRVSDAIPSLPIAVTFFGTLVLVIGFTIWTALKTPGEFTDLGPRRRWKI